MLGLVNSPEEASPEFVAGISDAIMASLLRYRHLKGQKREQDSTWGPGRLLAVSSGAIAAFLEAGTEAAVLAARRRRQGSGIIEAAAVASTFWQGLAPAQRPGTGGGGGTRALLLGMTFYELYGSATARS